MTYSIMNRSQRSNSLTNVSPELKLLRELCRQLGTNWNRVPRRLVSTKESKTYPDWFIDTLTTSFIRMGNHTSFTVLYRVK